MLKQKTKKLWSRLGAGMLLGLSLFNLGSFFGQNNASVPKSAGHFRRRDDRYTNPELRGILQTVEKEAQEVISQQEKIHKNLETQQLTFGQTFLRYGVVASWVLVAGIVFSSLIFNFPLALGRMALSALPGTVHLAVLKLVAEPTTVIPGEKFNLDLFLKSDEAVSAGKVFFQYPQEKFFLEKIDSQFSPQLSFQPDGLLIVFNDLKEGDFSGNESLAQLSFSVGDEWKNGDVLANPIKISWEKSLILNVGKENQTAKNILGKVVDAQFSVATGKTENLYCQSVVDNAIEEKFWQEWMVSSPTDQQSNKWNQLNSDWSLGCALGSEGAGILIVGKKEVKELSLISQQGNNKETGSPVASWQSGEQIFSVFSLPKNVLKKDGENWKVDWFGADEKISWPVGGWATLRLIQKNN